MTAYPHLFSPLEIGNVTVRNRIMQTAHVKLWAYNAADSERNVAYQAARAKGGAGLLITGNRGEAGITRRRGGQAGAERAGACWG